MRYFVTYRNVYLSCWIGWIEGLWPTMDRLSRRILWSKLGKFLRILKQYGELWIMGRVESRTMHSRLPAEARTWKTALLHFMMSPVIPPTSIYNLFPIHSANDLHIDPIFSLADPTSSENKRKGDLTILQVRISGPFFTFSLLLGKILLCRPKIIPIRGIFPCEFHSVSD